MQRYDLNGKKKSEASSFDKNDQKFCKQLTKNNDEMAFQNELDQFYKNREAIIPTPVNNLDELLEDNFIIGEGVHSDVSSKAFLIENMFRLRHEGFTTLFMEHLCYDDQQELDDYFNDRAPLSQKLKNELENLYSNVISSSKEKSWQQYNFLQIIEAAKKANIRVVGLDTRYTYQMQNSLKHMNYFYGYPSGEPKDNYRLQSMNYTAYQIIERESKKTKGKWLALMGVTHIKEFTNSKQLGKVLGVSELLGVRAVLSKEKKENTPAEILFGQKVEVLGEVISAELAIVASQHDQPRFPQIDTENRKKLKSILDFIDLHKKLPDTGKEINRLIKTWLESGKIIDDKLMQERLTNLQDILKNKTKSKTGWFLSSPITEEDAKFNKVIYDFCEDLKPSYKMSVSHPR